MDILPPIRLLMVYERDRGAGLEHNQTRKARADRLRSVQSQLHPGRLVIGTGVRRFARCLARG